MIFYSTQQIADRDFLKYTLTSFQRARVQQHDGSVVVENVHCHLVYYSREEMLEDVAKHRGDCPLPEVIDHVNMKEVKWSKGLHWKEPNW